jgi:uroporphyrinogen decarboxylase
LPLVSTSEDVAGLRRRLEASAPGRYPADLDASIEGWLRRDCSLGLGRTCAIHGFCRQARQLMGDVNVSLDAGDEHSGLIHEVMTFWADFLIETSRPVLEKIHVDFVILHEDPSLKGAPLQNPETYRAFVFPHLKRLVDFFREHGTRYVAVDVADDPTALIPHLMEAGVDTLMPIDRAADTGPQEWRRRFGPSLRLWGGVDPRILLLGADAVRAHLREFIPLIEEGGFIPMVDRPVPPDVSWDAFRAYIDLKQELLCGNFAALGA